MKKILIFTACFLVRQFEITAQSLTIMPATKQSAVYGMDWKLFSNSNLIAERHIVESGKILKWYEKSGAMRGGSDTYITAKTGIASLSYGIDAEAAGDVSFAFGVGVHSFNYSGFACGMYNSHQSNSLISDHEFNRLFVVGYGTSESNVRDAFIVQRNGNIGIGTESIGSRLDIRGRNNDGYSANRKAQVAIQSGEATTYFNDFQRNGATFINGHDYNSSVVLSEASISQVGIGIVPIQNGAKLQVNGDVDCFDILAADVYGDNAIFNQYWLYNSSSLAKTFLASYPELTIHKDKKGKEYIDFMEVLQRQMIEISTLKTEVKKIMISK